MGRGEGTRAALSALPCTASPVAPKRLMSATRCMKRRCMTAFSASLRLGSNVALRSEKTHLLNDSLSRCSIAAPPSLLHALPRPCQP